MKCTCFKSELQFHFLTCLVDVARARRLITTARCRSGHNTLLLSDELNLSLLLTRKPCFLFSTRLVCCVKSIDTASVTIRSRAVLWHAVTFILNLWQGGQDVSPLWYTFKCSTSTESSFFIYNPFKYSLPLHAAFRLVSPMYTSLHPSLSHTIS